MKKCFLLSLLVVAVTLFPSCKNKTQQAAAIYLKAFECYERKDFDRATALLDAVLQTDKNFNQAKFLKGKIHFFKNEYQLAANTFNQLSEKEPHNIDIKIFLVRSLLLNQNYDEAFWTAKNCLKENSSDWRFYYYAGVASIRKGNIEVGFSMLREAEKALTEGAKVFYEESFIWNNLGIKEKAEECMERYKNLSEI